MTSAFSCISLPSERFTQENPLIFEMCTLSSCLRIYRELIILKEAETEERRITNCETTERERHLYTSKSNAIEIRLLSSNIDAPQFLVQYTGKLLCFLFMLCYVLFLWNNTFQAFIVSSDFQKAAQL